MRYTSSKGYLICGITCFVLSGLLFCFSFVCMVLAEMEGEGSVFSKLCLLGLFIIVLIPFGIACFAKNNENKITLRMVVKYFLKKSKPYKWLILLSLL